MQKIKIGIVGFTGKMGQILIDLIEKSDRYLWSAGYAKQKTYQCSSLKDLFAMSDVVVDFTHASFMDTLLQTCDNCPKPLVCGTTGLSEPTKALMAEVAKWVPLFYAPNFSLGFYLFNQAAALISSRFTSDIDLIETHHSTKKDIPSGSAKKLAAYLPNCHIHSIRASNVTGLHELRMQSVCENITLTHEAKNRSCFAEGALQAASFIQHKEPGLYGMEELLEETACTNSG
jgi:4-hydroxy-tetrahydrodipicolinate reductase